MTESDQQAEVPAEVASPKRPIFWYVITGILVLVILVSVAWGAIALNTVSMQLTKSKAVDIAAALQMVNADLLGVDGNTKATNLFVNLCNDPSVAYVILLDKEGNVIAASNASLMSEADSNAVAADSVAEGKPLANANYEAVGPITDANGAKVGAVRVGVIYNAPSGKSAKK